MSNLIFWFLQDLEAFKARVLPFIILFIIAHFDFNIIELEFKDSYTFEMTTLSLSRIRTLDFNSIYINVFQKKLL